MQYNVSQLMREHTGVVRRYVVDENIRNLAPEDATVEAPLTGEITLMKDTEGILVTGKLHTELGVLCVRCLEPCQVPVDFEIEEQFFPTVDVETGRRLILPPDIESDVLIDAHHILDLSEVVRQSLIVAAPIKPVHAAGCALVEPEGEEPEAEESVPTAVDGRWAALQSLRDGPADNGEV